ncbi:MarR family winged helix-turn-helix transcriptional regulator [Agrobacterium salinitolerans]|jgi:DNA-binding MarR family transcriptional regulator|uniref:MarR family transcriptional regulator n=1 Tax=Agrobacterium salinitolerans TaxID=1183413 RepID=A0A9X3KQ42_9HYPH|nr:MULTISPECIES: MarR family transcriptional regulator [Agrobacterium]MCZ7856556.1 MarR family transcriptional regulator [Agrobacterium salinitolerans]MCZ7863392.1 MarR family transcriptional regulator [Agrobacterium salinitolerans]MCZ7889196.1 MarR family transcriptional regulator [Agrobacterium salinitolerans]MCZ7938839.1 MarR family transcriptional regulator [Agrobacterium salinitolerans]MDA5631200.1 MarR family transcriptional regulator [Agrobacterium sp. ST15.16.055]
MSEEPLDHVDHILAQWRRERPDLDVDPMGLLGRLNRLSTHLGREVEAALLKHGLSSSAFDVLATLRRSGSPYRLSPGDLLAMTMVSSGTMTNRIDQLEKAGLVERIHNPNDRRSVLISLTERGLAIVEEAAGAHVENQHRLVAGLSEEDRATLNRLLKRFLRDFEE